MKRLFSVVLLGFIGFLTSSSGTLHAQSFESGDPYLMDQIMEDLEEQLNDVPANIRRVAVYKINYSSLRFSSEEIEYIRSEIEYAFRQYAGLIVLSPPELEPNDKMKIVGSDSTLQILNIRGRSLADVSPEMLIEISEKYGVQGLIELSVQRRTPEGLVVALRMMNPQSREIVWTKSFVSNEKPVVVEHDKGKTSVIKFGVGSRGGSNIFTPDSLAARDSSFVAGDSTLSEIVVNIGATYTYRQPLNKDNSAYLGFTGGFHVLLPREVDEFDMTLIEFGVTYYQAIGKRIEDINAYRVAFYLNGNVQFPLGKPEGQMFSANPGLLFNLTENLGLAVYSQITLSGETITLDNTQQVTFDKLSYGIQGIIRF